MHKSKTQLELSNFSHNRSNSNLELTDKKEELKDEIIIEFEGDGILGIQFVNNKHKVIVNSIIESTVASEYYDLSVGLIVSSVDGINCSHLHYKDVVSLINKNWKLRSYITIGFHKPDSPDIIIDEIFEYLNRYKLAKYYQDFITLGANTVSDFEYVEYQDLVNMKMNSEERKVANQYLLNPSRNVYINPLMSQKSKEKEKLTYKSDNDVFMN